MFFGLLSSQSDVNPPVLRDIRCRELCCGFHDVCGLRIFSIVSFSRARTSIIRSNCSCSESLHSTFSRVTPSILECLFKYSMYRQHLFAKLKCKRMKTCLLSNEDAQFCDELVHSLCLAGQSPHFWKHHNNQWAVDTSTVQNLICSSLLSGQSTQRSYPQCLTLEQCLHMPIRSYFFRFLAKLFVLESLFAAMLTHADTCLAAKLLGSAYQISLALPGWCPLWSPSLFVSCKVKSCRILLKNCLCI
jgi:hypothetical protein